MKLYFAPGACSLAPHIILREVGATFDLDQVDNRTKKTKSGADFWQINPKGYVPVLELDNGERLTENPAILQYIGDQFPASGVVPLCGTFDRYRVQEWLNFVTSEIHKPYSSLFKPDTPEEYKTIAKENLAKRYDYVDQHLAKHQYLYGEKVRGGGCLSVRDFQLDAPLQHGHGPVAECEGVVGAHRRTPEGDRGHAGGGVEEVASRARRELLLFPLPSRRGW